MSIIFDKQTPLATLKAAEDTRQCIAEVRKYIRELETKATNPLWDRRIHRSKNWCPLHDYFSIRTKEGSCIIVKKIA